MTDDKTRRTDIDTSSRERTLSDGTQCYRSRTCVHVVKPDGTESLIDHSEFDALQKEARDD